LNPVRNSCGDEGTTSNNRHAKKLTKKCVLLFFLLYLWSDLCIALSPDAGETFGNVPKPSPDAGETFGNMPEPSPDAGETFGNVPKPSPDAGETFGNMPEPSPDTGETFGNGMKHTVFVFNIYDYEND
jgi:hypothetical protein